VERTFDVAADAGYDYLSTLSARLNFICCLQDGNEKKANKTFLRNFSMLFR
jgi:hypothetical protein